MERPTEIQNANPQTTRISSGKHLLPEVRAKLKDRAKELFPLYGKSATCKALIVEFGITERMAYFHVENLVKELYGQIDKDAKTAEIMSAIEKRKRYWLQMYASQVPDERHPDRKPDLRVQALALAGYQSEERHEVDMLLKLGIIEAPKERLEHSGEVLLGVDILSMLQRKFEERKLLEIKGGSA